MKSSSYITASEIGEYVYCQRAWWLKFKGYSKENSQMLAGTRAHNSLYRFLESLSLLKFLAISLILLGLILGLIIFTFSR